MNSIEKSGFLLCKKIEYLDRIGNFNENQKLIKPINWTNILIK